jgi:hypothetical protein
MQEKFMQDAATGFAAAANEPVDDEPPGSSNSICIEFGN